MGVHAGCQGVGRVSGGGWGQQADGGFYLSDCWSCLQGIGVWLAVICSSGFVDSWVACSFLVTPPPCAHVTWQARGILHCDVHPRNMGRRRGAGAGNDHFYLYDFGSSVTVAELAAGWDMRQPCSLLFSSVEVLLGGAPGPLADAQALIFSGLALAGVPLPWSGPAHAGNLLACVELKVNLMSDMAGQLPMWPGLFSQELQQLSEDIMHCALDGHGDGFRLAERLAGRRHRWGRAGEEGKGCQFSMVDNNRLTHVPLSTSAFQGDLDLRPPGTRASCPLGRPPPGGTLPLKGGRALPWG